MYKIIFDKSAEKDLDRLSREMIGRIVRVVNRLSTEPKPSGTKKIQASDENLYRVRCGDYRIIYAVEELIKIVNIRRIRHRKDVYRNL
jgi:mRNA interferase RelE/StbE